ncbi:beta-L-arabinofuranosidase domain-containing protein [Dysgonomonas sp. 25]|uniref:beta-L-arabinofuranosidase domain-containing protein n=1 Tax=Dysgonomonas sp. 25 TaxID=2302933 RepID=UPI0013D11C32|nr:beta-L-arabinofuranosidase domain-containing protein [Dysgonomonas sp. 25]NDV67298.1 hypothetical protein [Dysgonomonas sp. 25]
MKKVKKLLGNICCGIACIAFLISCNETVSDAEITITDRPVTTTANAHYIGNRAPLKPVHFIKLPVGAVKPEGWLKKYLHLQKDGLTGKLGEISAWLEKKDNAWLMSGGQHGWEEVPYWLKGYGNLAYILNDADMIAETKIWIDAAFDSQQPDGYFGPINDRSGKRELWANMIMVWCLQSYYEHSGDQRVIDLMTKYFKWQLTVPDDQFLEDYWENSRGGDNLYSIYWLYNITGDEFLLELAEKTHRNTANWMEDSWLPNWHNVNIAQCFREPATYYMLTGDSAHLAATYNVHNLIRRTFGQVPGGMFGADENARMGFIDPRQGTETCGFVEQMASDEILLRMTGDPLWAEHCEDIAFNSYPAAVMPDFKALRYITCPNHTISDSENHRPGIDNGGPFLAMNPFSSRCCQHNHAQGWPYFVENLILATPDNGLAAAIYGPCTANVTVGESGTNVQIKEETNYPFEEEIRFTITPDKDVNFPLYLRLPSWCDNPVVKINGATANVKAEAGKYIRIQREWKEGDTVTLELPMTLSMRTWQANKNSASINYGPLTLSLLIDEDYKKVNSAETAIWDSKWQKGADINAWPSYEIYPASAWNYALKVNENNLASNFEVVRKPWPANDFPFDTQNVPIAFKAKGRQIPSWGIDKYGLTGVLPDEDAKKSDVLDDITLIPMGAARLRISAFPVVTE